MRALGGLPAGPRGTAGGLPACSYCGPAVCLPAATAGLLDALPFCWAEGCRYGRDRLSWVVAIPANRSAAMLLGLARVACWPEGQLAGCLPAATAGLLSAYWPLRAVGWLPTGPCEPLAGCLLAREGQLAGAYWPLRAVGGLPTGPCEPLALPAGPCEPLAGCLQALASPWRVAYRPLRALGGLPTGPGGRLAGCRPGAHPAGPAVCLLARGPAGGCELAPAATTGARRTGIPSGPGYLETDWSRGPIPAHPRQRGAGPNCGFLRLEWYPYRLPCLPPVHP